jgi:uncharacterized protein
MRPLTSRLASRHPVATYFLAAFVLTWAVWVPRALVQQGLLDWDWPVLLGKAWTYGPALAAVAATAALAGRHGLRRLGGALVRWRVGWRWYAAVLLGPFALSATAMLLHERLTGQPAPWPVRQASDLLVFPLLILILAFTDGIGEEVGWRGFALPRLQEWLKPPAASVLIAVVWAAWHLPLLWTHGAPLEGRSFLMVLLQLIPTAILFTWVFNHTQGSVLMAILLHATQNLAGPPVPLLDEGLFTPYLLTVALKWVLAIVVLVLAPSFRLRHASRTPASPAAAPA